MHKRVFTAFSLKIFSNRCLTLQIARGHDVGDGVGGDWKQRYIFKGMKSFDMGVAGERES